MKKFVSILVICAALLLMLTGFFRRPEHNVTLQVIALEDLLDDYTESTPLPIVSYSTPSDVFMFGYKDIVCYAT